MSSGRTLDDWDDIEPGASGGTSSPKAPGSVPSLPAPPEKSAYGGGPASFDDDDFGEGSGGGASLELDLPTGHGRHASSGHPAAAPVPLGPAPQIALPASPGPLPRHPPQPAAPPPPVLQPPPPPDVHSPPPPQVVAAPASAPAPSDPRMEAAIRIGRFPPAPQKTTEMPLYALKVLYRKFELSQDIASLRKRRSPDVALYEQAARTHDPKAFLIGLVITIAACVVLMFLISLPVLLRFLSDPY